MVRYKLDLFKLNNPEETSCQWILASGKQLVKKFIFYVNDVCKQLKITKKDLALRLSKEFGAPIRRIKKILNGKIELLPLLIIEKITNLRGRGKKEIQEKIEYLYSKNSKVWAEKYLTKELCEIVGIHAADGCLTSKYFFVLKDEELQNIKLFIERLEKVFEIKPKIFKSTHENSYGIQFLNKIFARYLEKFFNFPLGKKTATVEMPDIIKGKKEAEIAFVRGVLTFEASVNISKSVSFYVISKKLRDDVISVLKKNNVSISVPQQPDLKGKYYFYSRENLSKNDLNKWLLFFIKKSEKWNKLFELINGFAGKVNTVDQAKKAFEITYPKGRKINISNLINFLSEIKEIDVKSLYNDLKISKTMIRRYLNILNHANIIIRSKILEKLLSNHLAKNVCITLKEDDRKKLFTEVNKKYRKDIIVCKMLGIKDYRYCKWKKGERGIPLDMLKKLIGYVKWSEEDLNVKCLDRGIVIFNENISNWRVPLR